MRSSTVSRKSAMKTKRTPSVAARGVKSSATRAAASRTGVARKSTRATSKRVHPQTHPTKQAHRMRDGMPDVRRINAQNRIRATITGTRNLDEAVHKVNIWLKELMERMQWDNRERALSAYRATLHALRDVLPYHDVVHFGAQLPLILKGVYYDSWVPRDTPMYEVNTVADFYNLVREKLGSAALRVEQEAVEDFTRGVLEVLVEHMGEPEMRKIKNLLREHVRQIVPVSLDH